VFEPNFLSDRENSVFQLEGYMGKELILREKNC
jgi:hypothetical protein